MSGMNKSDQRQNSKYKSKFQAQEKMKTWEVRKAKAIAKHNHFKMLKEQHPPTVARGTARALRRMKGK